MNRMLKTIGLALGAAFVLSAVAAASASAATHHFTGPAGSEVEVVANSTQLFKATTPDSKFISCSKVTAGGLFPLATDTDVVVDPKYETCEAISGETKVSAFVDTSQCLYFFQAQTTSGNPTGGEHANMIITKTIGEGTCHINITLTALKLKCISIPNQTVTDAVTYEQIENIGGSGKKGIRVNLTPHSIESTTTHSAACPLPEQKTVVHPGHTDDSGTYVGTIDLALRQDGTTKDFTLTKNAT